MQAFMAKAPRSVHYERELAMAYGGRIVGGEGTEPGEFPFLVAVTIDFTKFCGGTLIAPDTVSLFLQVIFYK